MTAEEYARRVVDSTAGKIAPARLYKGFYASRLHWLFVLLPHSALVRGCFNPVCVYLTYRILF